MDAGSLGRDSARAPGPQDEPHGVDADTRSGAASSSRVMPQILIRVAPHPDTSAAQSARSAAPGSVAVMSRSPIEERPVSQRVQAAHLAGLRQPALADRHDSGWEAERHALRDRAYRRPACGDCDY